MTERENLGLLPRLAAFGIDLVWLVAAAWPWLWWAGFTLKGLAGVALLTLGVLPCWRWMGGTPGQLLLSQRVVSDNGAPRLPWLRALLRWAAGWLALAPLGWGLGWMLVDREGRAWHDRVSGTQVVDGDPGVARTRVLRQHLAGEFPLAQSLWMLACGDGMVATLHVLPARGTRHADRRSLAETLRGDIQQALEDIDARHAPA